MFENQSEYKYDSRNPIFGKEGFHIQAEQEVTTEPQKSVESEKKEELAQTIEKELDAHNQELLEQIKVASPNLTSAETQRVAEKFQTSVNKNNVIDKIKNKLEAFSHGGLAGFGAAAATRSVVRNAVTWAFGGSLGVGVVAGGIAGGSIEGIKAYYKERNKFSGSDILEKLQAAQSDIQKAAVIEKAQKALKEARISNPTLIPELAQKIQIAKTELEVKLKSPEYANKAEKAKIAFILKLSKENRQDITREQKKEAQSLMKELKIKIEKSQVDKKKVMAAIGKGALVGALGGAIGGSLATWMAEAIRPEAVAGISQHIIDQHAQNGVEAYNAAMHRGVDQILTAQYAETAQHGEGLTHLARKGIHDLLANAHKLNPNQAAQFTPEQLVFAEDYIVKHQLHHGISAALHQGDHLNISGMQILEALNHAKNLNPTQLDNLHHLINSPEHLVSGKTIDSLENFSQFGNPANNFADSIINGARTAAEQASKTLPLELPSIQDNSEFWMDAMGFTALGMESLLIGKKLSAGQQEYSESMRYQKMWEAMQAQKAAKVAEAAKIAEAARAAEGAKTAAEEAKKADDTKKTATTSTTTSTPVATAPTPAAQSAPQPKTPEQLPAITLAEPEEEDEETREPEINTIVGEVEPNPLTQSEQQELSEIQGIINKMDVSLSDSLSEQQQDSFVEQDLVDVVRDIKKNHPELLPYLEDFQLIANNLDPSESDAANFDINKKVLSISALADPLDIAEWIIQATENIRDSKSAPTIMPATTPATTPVAAPEVIKPVGETLQTQSPEALEKQIIAEFPIFFEDLDRAMTKAQLSPAAVEDAHKMFATFIENIKEGNESLEQNSPKLKIFENDTHQLKNRMLNALKNYKFDFLITNLNQNSNKVSGLQDKFRNPRTLAVLFDLQRDIELQELYSLFINLVMSKASTIKI